VVAALEDSKPPMPQLVIGYDFEPVSSKYHNQNIFS
jgi:hypothetical protein